MGYEFDSAKSASNKLKHGIDFVEAQKLWNDERLLVIEGRSVSENRYLVIGIIGGKYHTACVTYRDEIACIISVRRARKEEVELYES